MRVHQQVATQVKVRTQTSPGLLLLSKLLMLNSTDLEQQIEQEVQENPAIEKNADDAEGLQPTAPVEDIQTKVFFSDRESLGVRPLDADDDESDTWNQFASYISLKEHLLSQVLPSLPEQLHPIARFLVESLDENGYLRIEEEEIAMRFYQPLNVIQDVLEVLQSCDPPGIGARSLQECLLLQLENLQNDPDLSVELSLVQDAERVLSVCWDDFVHERKAKVVKRSGFSLEHLEKVSSFIRHELVPYPGASFQSSNGHAVEAPRAMEPDVTVRASLSGFEIEIRGADPSALLLNPYYMQQYRRILQGSAKLSEQDKDHICHYVERAQLFINALRKRRETLRRIVEYIVRIQTNFFMTGDIRFVQPVTRAEVADRIGLHRSTVGRAVRNKLVQLPSGTVVTFDLFFKAANRVALLIGQILREQENCEKRLTDAEIAEQLAEMGVRVSRRAVAKYRSQHKILSSRWR
jgi:RNA polymerase sigma-54 factor